MTKIKKIGILGVALTTVAAPVLTTISCGSSAGSWKYDQNSSRTIRLWSSLSSSAQATPLAAVIKKYNDTKPATDKPVELVQISEGYDGITKNIRQKLEAKDKTTLPNLAIAYPDTIGAIARYDMHFDLASDSTGKVGVDSSLFDNQFTAINSQIAGVEQGFYSVPFAKSTDMLTTNEPVLKHFINTLISKGATKSATNSTKISNIIGKTNLDGDVTFIAENRFPVKSTGTIENYTISDDIFNNLEAMLDFVIQTTKVIDAKKDNYVMGIDSPTNMMYSMGYSLAAAQWDKFYFKKNSNGYIDYDFLTDGTESNRNFDKIYSKIAEAINSGGLYIRDVAPYSSDMSKIHKMALSIGSTAGYQYNSMASGAVYAKQTDNTTTLVRAEQVYYVSSYAVEEAGIKVTFANQANPANTVTLHSSEITPPTDLSKLNYDYYSKLTAQQIKTQLALPETPGDISKDDAKYVVQWDSRIVDSPSGYTDVKKLANVNLNEPLCDGTSPTAVTHQRFGNGLYTIDHSEMQFEPMTGSLQAAEMSISETPKTFSGKTTESKVTLIQGPSIIGVHANETDNLESKKFLNWLFTAQVEWTVIVDKVETIVTKTPAEYFSGQASYILPTKNFLNDTANAAKGNAAQKLAFSSLKTIMNDTSEYGFDNPVDWTTGTVRNNIAKAVYKGFNNWYTATSNPKAWTTKQVLDNIIENKPKQ